MTLQQRLLLNDKEQEDLYIVQTLKYLQDKGAYQAEESRIAAGAATAAHSLHMHVPYLSLLGPVRFWRRHSRQGAGRPLHCPNAQVSPGQGGVPS